MWRVLLREDVIQGQRDADHPCPQCGGSLTFSRFQADTFYCTARCGHNEPVTDSTHVVYWQRFWILATNGRDHYLPGPDSGVEWLTANATLQRILACPDFTPQGKPKLWARIRDTKETRPPKWRRLKNWWIEHQR